MSDLPPSEPQEAALTAGGLLRQARVAKGLHIAALATSIKVAPRKLELLEGDRFDELPGATFTRALAQTVCRSLKIDAAPVLALLPQPVEQSLSQMGLGLNAPFRDRPGRRVPSDLQFVKSPVALGAAFLVLASLALYLLPAGWINEISQQPSGVTESVVPPIVSPLPAVAESASTPGFTAAGVAELAASEVSGAASGPAPVASQVTVNSAAHTGSVLLLRTSAESWVEVIDGRGTPLLSRMLQRGETVALDGASPLRVRIGNALATQVSFKGKPVLLTPTRDNVAKLELR